MGFHNNLRGDDLHSPSRETVKNESGATLTSLKVVKFSGGLDTNGIPKVVLISNLNDKTRGVVKTDISNNTEGIINSFGVLTDVDTSAFTLDDILYSDANGVLSSTPTTLRVAQVLKVDATTGVIYINLAGEKGDKGNGGWLLHGVCKNVGSNSTIDASYGSAEGSEPLPVIKNGKIIGLGISLNATRSVGDCELAATINAIRQNGAGQTVKIDATNLDNFFILFGTPINYVAGDIIGGQTVTTSFTPSGGDATIGVYMEDD